jgi:hypothetical protein
LADRPRPANGKHAAATRKRFESSHRRQGTKLSSWAYYD